MYISVHNLTAFEKLVILGSILTGFVLCPVWMLFVYKIWLDQSIFYSDVQPDFVKQSGCISIDQTKLFGNWYLCSDIRLQLLVFWCVRVHV